MFLRIKYKVVHYYEALSLHLSDVQQVSVSETNMTLTHVVTFDHFHFLKL